MNMPSFFKGALLVLAILVIAVNMSESATATVIVVTAYAIVGVVGVAVFLMLFVYALKCGGADTRILDLNFGKASLIDSAANTAAGVLVCALLCLVAVFLT